VKIEIERLGIYISINWRGFYIEFGKLDPPTPILTFALTLDWWK
jgi:hypothetical protein